MLWVHFVMLVFVVFLLLFLLFINFKQYFFFSGKQISNSLSVNANVESIEWVCAYFKEIIESKHLLFLNAGNQNLIKCKSIQCLLWACSLQTVKKKNILSAVHSNTNIFIFHCIPLTLQCSEILFFVGVCWRDYYPCSSFPYSFWIFLSVSLSGFGLCAVLCRLQTPKWHIKKHNFLCDLGLWLLRPETNRPICLGAQLMEYKETPEIAGVS